MPTAFASEAIGDGFDIDTEGIVSRKARSRGSKLDKNYPSFWFNLAVFDRRIH